MSHLDAIAEVLKAVNVPMSCRDLADEVICRGLITEYGKTLHASFSRDLNKDIAKGSSRFVKVAAGRFGLVANAKRAIQDADALMTAKQNQANRQVGVAKRGFVYILRDDHCKRCVKIGKTGGSLQKRLHQLQTGNPWIREYASLETSRYEDVERFLHNVIKLISRGKQVGTSEFYRFDPEDAKSILMEFERLLPADDYKLKVYENSISKASAGRTKRATATRIPSVVGEAWSGKTQLAKLIARRGGNEGAFGGILHFFGRKRPCQKGSKWRGSLEKVGIRFDVQDMVIDWSVAKNPL